MANITVNIMLGWCGITVAANRNCIIANMITAPEGINHLNDESTEGLLSTYWDYAKRVAADWKITLTQIKQRRIIALKYWVKDRFRLEEGAIFEHGTTWQVFIKAIDHIYKSKKSRTNQQKSGESLIMTAFQVKLETATQ